MTKILIVLYYLIFFAKILYGAESTNKSLVVIKVDDSTLINIEIYKGKISQSNIENILQNKYLVSSLYYSNIFFEKIKKYGVRQNIQNKILLNIKSQIITDEFRDQYIKELSMLVPKNEESSNIVSPLDSYITKVRKSSHPDAIDLFTSEGSAVKSASYGIVVLAENAWVSDYPDIAVSNNCGNHLIIFSPDTKRFYRYCHLASINVDTKDIVMAGEVIGTVGHTGRNASKPGHGDHLHFEINQYEGNFVRYTSKKNLLEMLKNVKQN